jgi:rubrerythrin
MRTASDGRPSQEHDLTGEAHANPAGMRNGNLSDEGVGEDESSQLDGAGRAAIEIDDSDVNLLVALAEMDAEAAEAYRIAAEHTDEVHFRAKLEEFRGDHLRHVEAINRLLDEASVAEVSTELDEDSSAVTMLAASMGVMGVRASLLMMLANERLTLATYQAVSELPFEEGVAQLVSEHLADEERHLEWLVEQEPTVGPEEDDEAEQTEV